jgi:cytochrome P450
VKLRSPRLLFNPYDPEVRADPYPHYRHLRETEPVHRSPLGFWVLSRYDDVVAAQKDSRLGLVSESVEALAWSAGDESSPVPALARRALLVADRKLHRRFRALLGRCFTPQAAETIRPRVERVVRGVLDTLPDAGPVELAQGFARRLPIAIVSTAFGLPDYGADQYLIVAKAIGRFLDVALDLRALYDLSGPLLECERDMRDVVVQRRRSPGDDLLSLAMQGTFEGQGATDDELVSYLSLVLGASYETTSNFIGNSLMVLANHPDQLDLLRREPGLVNGAVEELLRYESPAQLHGRYTLEDIVVRDRVVPRGSKIIMLIGAANRDPAAFADPDRFDIGRHPNPHASFGHGTHYCLGAWITRLVAQVTIPLVLARYPRLGPVVGAPEWQAEQVAVRALRRLVMDAGPC